MKTEIDRRAFLAAAGASFLVSLSPARADRLLASKALFVSGYMSQDRSYGFAIVDEDANIIHRETLPGRAHGFAVSRDGRSGVGFARRPGTFAIAFDPYGMREPKIFHAPGHRHFYGHGVFSPDGKLLFSTENDFRSGRGKIGIYDATDAFRRIGEFDSYGTGPHEIVLLNDGRTLAVANSGIRTHPDSGRTKLNLPQMRSQIVLIDYRNGEKTAGLDLPGSFQRMSLRHMACAPDGSIWIGGQYQGDVLSAPSPICKLDRQGGLKAITIPENVKALLAGYVGSVAITGDGNFAGFSSPQGGAVVTFEVASGALAQLQTLTRACGLAGVSSGLIISNEHGRFAGQSHQLHWDNHIAGIGSDLV